MNRYAQCISLLVVSTVLQGTLDTPQHPDWQTVQLSHILERVNQLSIRMRNRIRQSNQYYDLLLQPSHVFEQANRLFNNIQAYNEQLIQRLPNTRPMTTCDAYFNQVVYATDHRHLQVVRQDRTEKYLAYLEQKESSTKRDTYSMHAYTIEQLVSVSPQAQ